MIRAFLLLIVSLFALCACDLRPQPENSDTEYARKLITALQAHDFDQLTAQPPRADRPADWKDTLAKVASLIPAGAPSLVEVASWQVTSITSLRGSSRKTYVALQYEFDGKWLLAEFWWHRDGAGPVLLNQISVSPLAGSLQSLNRFTFYGKGAIHYLVFALAILFPLFSISVLALCLRTPMRMRYKVLWTIAILLGVGLIDLNWTTGEITFAVLHLLLFSAGWVSAGLGPWHMHLAFPLGAILFLFWRQPEDRIEELPPEAAPE